jgi:hypothetical protein
LLSQHGLVKSVGQIAINSVAKGLSMTKSASVPVAKTAIALGVTLTPSGAATAVMQRSPLRPGVTGASG